MNYLEQVNRDRELLEVAQEYTRPELRTIRKTDTETWNGILSAARGFINIFSNKSRYPFYQGEPTASDFTDAGNAHVILTRVKALDANQEPKSWWRGFGRRISHKRGAKNNN